MKSINKLAFKNIYHQHLILNIYSCYRSFFVYQIKAKLNTYHELIEHHIDLDYEGSFNYTALIPFIKTFKITSIHNVI